MIRIPLGCACCCSGTLSVFKDCELTSSYFLPRVTNSVAYRRYVAHMSRHLVSCRRSGASIDCVHVGPVPSANDGFVVLSCRRTELIACRRPYRLYRFRLSNHPSSKHSCRTASCSCAVWCRWWHTSVWQVTLLVVGSPGPHRCCNKPY